MRTFLVITVAFALAIVPRAYASTIVSVEYLGTVTSGFGVITPGSSIVGNIQYDTSVSQVTRHDASGAWYDAIASLDVTYENDDGGVFTYSAADGHIVLSDDVGWTTRELTGPSIDGIAPKDFFVVSVADFRFPPSRILADLPTSFSDDDLLFSVLLQTFDGSSEVIQGKVTSLTAVVVPEVTITWLVWLPLLGMFRRRRQYFSSSR